MPALLFGSISTIADTSEIQHGAFNYAFEQHGLDWNWSREDYQRLIQSNGGEQRIADEAKKQGVEVDAAAVHKSKTDRFQEELAGVELLPRPGVLDVIKAAKDAGWKIGFVTTTVPGNITALFKATGDKVNADDFDVITDLTRVDTRKPDPSVYQLALRELGVDASDAVAIEDNLGGVASAKAAGIAIVAFPNENTVVHDFGDTETVSRLEWADLQARIGAGA